MNWVKVIDALFAFIDAFLPKAPPTLPPTPPQKPEEPEPIEHAGVVLARQAQAWLGRDPSTPDLANDELGCADSVSAVIKTVYKDFPHTVSTITLHQYLKNSKHFKPTLQPSMGCVVVSPRQGAQPGHTGIFITDNRIASNDSKRGLWLDNYSFKSWVDYFRLKKGLRVFLFEPV